jgi:hypothetical protein
MIFSYPLTRRSLIGCVGFSGLRGEPFLSAPARDAKRGARGILEACLHAWRTVIGPIDHEK